MRSFIFVILLFYFFLNVKAQNNPAKNDSSFSYADTTLANEYVKSGKLFLEKGENDSALIVLNHASNIYNGIIKKYNEKKIWEKYLTCNSYIGNALLEKDELDQALQILNQSLNSGLSKLEKDNIVIALIYTNIGDAYSQKADYDKALEYCNEAIDVFKRAKDNNSLLLASTYKILGNTYLAINKFEDAKYYYNQSLLLVKNKFGEIHPEIASLYNNIGAIYYYIKNLKKTIEYFDKALKIRIQILGNQNPSIAVSYNNLGAVYVRIGKYEEAIENFNYALKIWIDSYGDKHSHVAACYKNIASIYSAKGYFDEALSYYYKSLSIYKKVHDLNHPDITSLYNDIGATYNYKGDYTQGIEYFNQALNKTMQKYGKYHTAIQALHTNFGRSFFMQKKYDKALYHFRESFLVNNKLFGENNQHLARDYKNIASTLYKQGEIDSAIIYYKKSLDIFNNNDLKLPSWLCATLNDLGSLYTTKKDFAKAQFYIKKALHIEKDLNIKNHPDIANSYLVLGKLYSINNELAKSLKYYQKAIITLTPSFSDSSIYSNPLLINTTSNTKLLNAFKQKAILLRKKYFSVSKNIIDLNMSLSTLILTDKLLTKLRHGYFAETSKIFIGKKYLDIYDSAIQTALDLYNVSKNNKYKENAFYFAEKSKTNVLASLLQETNARSFVGIPDTLLENEKKLRIDLTFYETKLQKEEEKSAKADSSKIQVFQNNIFSLKRKYEKLINDFENDHPEYYDLKYADTVPTIQEIQKNLDDKTAIIEYFIGDSSIYIFTISKDKYYVKTVSKDSIFENKTKEYYTAIKKMERETFILSSKFLYNFLIKPIKKQISSKEKLIIIPSDNLFYTPFESFIAGESSDNSTQLSELGYLIKKYDISYHYSSTILMQNLKKEINNRNVDNLIGFAPVFSDKENNGFIIANSSDIRDTSAVYRSITIDGKRYKELKYSEQELSTILDQFKHNRLNGIGFFHGNATEDNFKENTVGKNIIHLATHGFINEENPKLSGLVFSQPKDSLVKEDGILYANEMYNLDLDADLIVLSSCESGIGKLVKGEGLMSMTRGFLYSGKKNIIVSLWKVYDKQTSLLMINFYKNILAGHTFSSALREAKLNMIEKSETAFPKMWSGFVLIGH